VYRNLKIQSGQESSTGESSFSSNLPAGMHRLRVEKHNALINKRVTGIAAEPLRIMRRMPFGVTKVKTVEEMQLLQQQTMSLRRKKEELQSQLLH
jgi:hypothetical protein